MIQCHRLHHVLGILQGVSILSSCSVERSEHRQETPSSSVTSSQSIYCTLVMYQYQPGRNLKVPMPSNHPAFTTMHAAQRKLLSQPLLQVNIATKKVECTVQGVQPIPRGLTVEQASGQLLSTTGHLVLPASHASLQIYDPLLDRHVAGVQVRPEQHRNLSRNLLLSSSGLEYHTRDGWLSWQVSTAHDSSGGLHS